MARSKKDRRKGPHTRPDFDLLGAMFNMPTRRDIERAAERRAAQAHHVRVQCRGDEDDDDTSSSSESSESSSSASSSFGKDEAGADEVRSGSAGSSQQQGSQSKSRPRGRSRTVKPRDEQSQQQKQQKQKKGSESSHRKSKSDEKRQRHQQHPESGPRDSKRTLTKSCSFTNTARSSQLTAPSVPPSASYPSFAGSQGFIMPHGVQAGGTTLPAPMQYYHAQPFALAPPPLLQPSVAPMQHIATVLAPPHPPPRAPQHPAGLVAQQIHRIQAEIDRKAALLSLHPSDQTLKNDLHALQAKLNSTLNAVLDAKTPAKTSPEPPAMADRTIPARDTAQRFQESNIEPPQRDVSPERAVRHHLCSGCGGVRSAKFHDKHPVVAGEKPVLNFCKACQSASPENELLARYHFCFRCGIVRSKEFQRKHRTQVMLPNYCGKCTAEIQAIVGIAEASVADFNSQSSSSCETEEPGTSSSLVVEVTPEMEYSSAQPLDLPALAAPRQQQASSASISFAKHVKNIKPLNIPQSQHAPGLKGHSPEKSYFPQRSSGAAQRRAQRGSLASSSGSGELDAHHKDDASAQAYRAPYVEDDQSPPVQRQAGAPQSAPQSIFAPQQPATFEHGQPCGPGEGQFEESSGYVTEESNSDSTVAPDYTSNRPSTAAEPAGVSTQGDVFEDTARFWRGAFARRTSPVEERNPSSFSSSPSSSSGSSTPPPPPPHAVPRTASSPEASHFPGFPDTYAQFSHPSNDMQDDDPPLRTSRGAFGSSAFRNSFGDMRSPHSASPASPSPRDHQSSSWGGGGPSSPYGVSSFAGFGSRFEPPEDANPAGSGSDSGYHNPYYIPRKRPSFGLFADVRGAAFGRRSCRVRAGDGGWSYAWRKPTPGWIPEPIIEEPPSPIASPRQRAMLLEFGTDSAGTVSPVPPLSDASSDSSDADALSISDMDGDHHCDHSDDDDHGRDTRFYED